MIYIFNIICLLICFFSFFTCQNSNSNQLEKKHELPTSNHKAQQREIKYSKKWNDFKNFLTGNPDKVENANLYTFAKKDWYKKYQSNISSYNIKYDKQKDKITKWIKENLKEVYNVKNAFYLLSGADFYYLRLFYPNAENYVMFAMEKEGNFPDLDSIDENSLQSSLSAIEEVIFNLSHNTYLFSKTMNKFLNQDKTYKIYGTFPLITFYIGYFNGNIIEIKKECLEYKENFCLIPGFSIQYEDGQQIKNVYYYSKKLLPEDIQENSPLDSLMKSYKEKGLFLKAAVYLLHNQKYQNFANYLAENFQYIIQEDSGIPYRLLQQHKFNVRLYGRYIDVPKLTGMKVPFQPDLAKDFKQNSEKLTFHFGYGTARVTGISNLIFAYKNQ